MSSQDDRVRELELKLEEALAAVRDLRYENDLLRARVVDRRPESTDTPARDPMPLGAVGTTIGRDSSEAEKITLEVLATCDYLGAPAALERSRSGRGAHLWVFFNSPVAAATARNLGCALLTRALDKRHQIGFDSYDRLFPNQDTMPRGGFGNLIALPLQRVARHSGNTEFLDRDFQPFPDQWKFLASIPRLTATDCERIVRDAAREGMILGIEASWFETEEQAREPWTLSPSRHRRDAPIAGPMPAAVEVVIANRVFIPKPELPPAMLSRLRRLAVFQNPEFYRAQAMRLSTWDKPRVIDCSEDFLDHLALPRGTLAEVLKVFEKQGVWVNLKDERQGGTSVALSFKGELTDDQRVAAEALVAHDIGVLVAPTAFGKTVIGAWLIAKRGVNTLVLVHRQQLADQWRERLAAFLDIPTRSIGQFGAGRNKGKGTIDIGILQSLSAKGQVRDVVADYGQVLIDECQHVPAVTFERVLSEVRARYVTGLTATPTRKDGHDPILVLQCGPIRHRVDARAQAEAQPFEHVVVPRLTSFALSVDAADAGIQEIYSRLVNDQARTDMIVTDVLEAVADGRAPLVLTERTEHLERMQELLASRVENLVVLRGRMGAGERRAVAASLKSIPDHSPRVCWPRAATSARDSTMRARFSFPCAAGLVERHHPAIRGKAAPTPRAKTGGNDLRLRRRPCSNAGQDVSEALTRVRSFRLLDGSWRHHPDTQK